MGIKPQAKAILKNLAELGKSVHLPWPTIGQLLDQVDRNDYWAMEGAKSFTEWLQQHAVRSGMGIAILWRILSATRFYRVLQKRYPELGLMPLDSIPSNVTPDHLEQLSKLSRVMSRAEFKAQLQQVLKGKISRTQLRNTWRAFRPVLDGRTARGRNQPVPRANPRDPEQFHSLIEARIYQAIARTGTAWTGIKKPALYRLLVQSGPYQISGSPRQHIFDAVAVMQETLKSGIQIHGLEFTSIRWHWHLKAKELEFYLPFCDYMWVAICETPSEKELAMLTPEIGILVARDNRVDTIRSAQHVAGDPAKREMMLRGVLARALRT